MTDIDPSRIDRIEAEQDRTTVDMEELRQLVEVNTKLIRALDDQAALDRAKAQSIRDDVADLFIITRIRSEVIRFQERQIKIHAGKIHAVTTLAEKMYSCKSYFTK